MNVRCRRPGITLVAIVWFAVRSGHAMMVCGLALTMWLPCLILFFFFFQAEDGIRDLTVTGVQTCALPILCRSALGARPLALGATLFLLATALAWGLAQLLSPRAAYLHVGAAIGTIMAANEIGRASCRERV